DMKMPGVDGWAFARAYRQRSAPRPPVVVVTAAGDAASWAAEIAADDVLAKPFDLDHLLELVARYTTPA
ncbi:MAG: response regulator, partial [Chloroflexi bacterium]|nr:response regulator [Chloroflexota bacterium]